MPNITHAGSLSQPLFEPASGAAGLVAQWATYPAVSNVDMSGNMITNASDITLSGVDPQIQIAATGYIGIMENQQIGFGTAGPSAVFGYTDSPAPHAFLEYEGSGLTLDGSTITSSVPVVAPEFVLPLDGTDSAPVIFNDLSGAHQLKSVDGNLYFDLELLAKANDIQDIGDWSEYPAVANVEMNQFGLEHAGFVQIDPSGGAAAIVLSSDASGNLLKDGQVVALASQIPSLAQWATYPAVAAVDLSGHPITDVSSLEIMGGILSTTGGGTTLLFNGAPISTGGGGSTSQWATFPAVATVNLAGNNVTGNGGAIQLTSGTLGATLIDNSEKTYTRLLEVGATATFDAPIQQPYSLASGSNFMGNPLTIGDTSPIYTGGLTVYGPATLDGGSLHGTSIGCLPVSGINTVRIDALPVGTIDLLAPAAITINAGGAGNFACGGALSLAGGGYIEMNTGEVQMINTTSGQSLLSVNTIQGNSHNGGDGKLYLEKLVSINAGTPGTTVAVSSTLDFDTGPATSITGAKEINATFVTTDRLGSTFSSTIRVEQDLSGNPGVAYRADTLEARTQIQMSGLAPLIAATDPSPIAIELRAANGVNIQNNVGNHGLLASGPHSIYSTAVPTDYVAIGWDDAAQRVITSPNGTGLNYVAYLSDIPTAFRPSYDIYVAPNGNDTTGTGSSQSPLQTIAAALTLRGTLSTSTEVSINLASGTYTENVTIATVNTYLAGAIATGEVRHPTNITGNITVSAGGTVGVSNLDVTGTISTTNSSTLLALTGVNTTSTTAQALLISAGTAFVSECRFNSGGGAATNLIQINSTGTITMRDCVAAQTLAQTVLSSSGTTNIRQCYFSNSSASTSNAPIVRFTGTTTQAVEMNYTKLVYTNTSVDVGGNKCCIQFNSASGTINAEVAQMILSCVGAQTGSPQIQCIQHVGAGVVNLTYGDLQAVGAATHIAPSIIKTSMALVA